MSDLTENEDQRSKLRKIDEYREVLLPFFVDGPRDGTTQRRGKYLFFCCDFRPEKDLQGFIAIGPGVVGFVEEVQDEPYVELDDDTLGILDELVAFLNEVVRSTIN